MAAWEPGAAAALVGLAAFQLLSMYKDAAPDLGELRDATPGDPTHYQLQDADLTVGTLAAIVGLSMAYLTKDWTALLIMCFSLGSYILWYHAVLNRPAPN